MDLMLTLPLKRKVVYVDLLRILAGWGLKT